MYLLSFDVGIKNLAYCLIELNHQKKRQICQWDIIDLSFEDNSDKDLNYLIQNYKKMKINDLKSYMTKFELNTNAKKSELVKSVEHYLQQQKIIKKNPTILDTSQILVQKLDKLSFLNQVDTILIENQPSLKNPIMKSIQMILYTYFVIRGFIDSQYLKQLKFISARNKLKKCETIDQFKGKNKNYKDRKKLAVEYCSYLINDDFGNLKLFNQSPKKDDLADCYLQGIYYFDYCHK
tara:strand:+ start:54 stop:761 length:708 start_codon:yes stop_codon:yes gene_type:complete